MIERVLRLSGIGIISSLAPFESERAVKMTDAIESVKSEGKLTE